MHRDGFVSMIERFAKQKRHEMYRWAKSGNSLTSLVVLEMFPNDPCFQTMPSNNNLQPDDQDREVQVEIMSTSLQLKTCIEATRGS